MNSRGSLTRRLVLVGRALASWRPTWRWLGGVVRGFLVSFAALAVTLWVVPGEQVPSGGTETVATLVVTVLAVGALLRPFLTMLTVLTGVVGLLVTGFLAQTVILGVALSLVPGVEPIPVPELVVVAWCVAVVAAVLNWVVDTSSEEVFHGQVMGRAVRTARQREVTGPGLLVIQLDGVAYPLLRQAAAAGAMPFLTRTIRSGGHRLRGWHTGLPSTTPAGQAVLLHGKTTPIPAFRWYDKQRGRVLECSRPADAGEAEADMSTGDGLLAQGGVSVANLFSGDAPEYALTMSHPRLPGSERGAAAFASARSGFARSVVMLIGQVVVELYQGRRQRLRNVVPRVPRRGAFVMLRGLTTVVLRDLAVSIVADQMARGAPVVFVDFVDYDEVAHHAGPTRPESMRTLESLDGLIAFFTELAAEVGRDYEIAVVSDHGQTQGSTFLQLEGCTLADTVREIVEDAPHTGQRGTPSETLGPVNVLRASGRLPRRLAGHSHDAATQEARPLGPALPRVEVVASGSIAHLYLTDEPGRLPREQVDRLVPRLIPGLRAVGGIGVVLTRCEDGTLHVENAQGWRRLSAQGTAGGEGEDPLAAYGDHAAVDLLELSGKDHVGDVVVLGRFDPFLGEVAAFEELVGSHGGLGGWQTEALLVHPADWTVPDGPLDGRAVHDVLRARLVHLGLRRPDRGASAPTPRPDLEGSTR